jgi:hypothetical protein
LNRRDGGLLMSMCADAVEWRPRRAMMMVSDFILK